MDEHSMAGQIPATGVEAPATIPSTATMAQATAQAAAKSGGKKVTPARLVEQVSALQQAETIKQLQNKVTALESQSKDTGKIFLATTTTLITSAFALVAALAWNEAIQDLFKKLYPPPAANSSASAIQAAADLVPSWQLVISSFVYAAVVTIIVVAIIYYLTKLNTRLGAKSLIGEAPKAREG
jgi:predicted PurR-regulated permease PerM